MDTEQIIGIAAGVLALIWSFVVRRSSIDSILAALAGMLLLLMAMGWTEPLRPRGYYLLPELVLGGLGLTLLVRALVSRGGRSQPGVAGSGMDGGGAGAALGAAGPVVARQDSRQPLSGVQRTGLGVIGCVVTVPVLLFALMIGAFIWGGRSFSQKAQEEAERAEQRVDEAAEQAVRASIDRPQTARFRNHRWITQLAVARRYAVPDSSRCGEYTAEGMQGFRAFLYDHRGSRLFLANERGMLRFHNFRRGAPIDPEFGRPIAVGEQPEGRVEEASWSAFCGGTGAG